jgi:DNA-binding transcriptional LysR family regulator
VSHQAVIYTPGGGGASWTSWTFRKATAEVSVVLQGRLKVSAAEGVREAVNCDLGLAVSSEWNFWPELRSGQVVAILDDWALPMTNLSAVYPTGRLASTKARAFVSFVERFMGALSSVSPEPRARLPIAFKKELGVTPSKFVEPHSSPTGDG